MEEPAGGEISEPFPIFLVCNRYMLYDVTVVSYVRRKYHMCGCLIGTLPQVPQQNVFLGLPLELMVEEASLLVEKGVAYIVDDVEAHNLGRESMCEEDRKRYLTQRDEGLKVLADAHRKEALSRKFAALEKQGLSHLAPGVSGASTPARKSEKKNTPLNPSIEPDVISTGERAEENQEEEIDTSNPTIAGDSSTLFPSSSTSKSQPEEPQITIHSTAPTSHNPPTPYHKLPTSIQTPPHLLPQPNPLRNPIYRHLHSHGYYLSPGLRFGAQYMAYPGDPLRFHSHFVVNGLGWDEEISVLDIVGGGRLGTGVKKAWMVGGRDPSWTAEEGGAGGTKKGEDGVRVFSVEWGGF